MTFLRAARSRAAATHRCWFSGGSGQRGPRVCPASSLAQPLTQCLKHRQFIPVDRQKKLLGVRGARLPNDIQNLLIERGVILRRVQYKMAYNIEAVLSQVLEAIRSEIE